jgi:hypothetical protein
VLEDYEKLGSAILLDPNSSKMAKFDCLQQTRPYRFSILDQLFNIRSKEGLDYLGRLAWISFNILDNIQP